MAYTFNFLPSSKLSTCRNVNYAKLDLKIDSLSEFTVHLGNPTDWQLNEIVDDVEAQITVGNHSVYGYVKNHKYDDSTGTDIVTGYDYSIKLSKMYIHCDNVSQEDTSLSSDFRVIYTNVAFKTIAEDIITNSGFTVGTVDTYPVAGPDTTMSVKFEYMYVLKGLRYLASTANVSNVPYDLWIDNSKQLHLEDYRGSATSVKDYLNNTNCKILDFEGDTIRKAKRVVITGSRSGTSQINGVWPTAGFTPGDPEVAYYAPNVSDSTMAQELAHNLYNALYQEITYIELQVSNVNDNVQLGDVVTLTAVKPNIATVDYRVVRIIREYWPNKQSLRLFLSISTNKNRKKTIAEILGENKGLVELSGNASRGGVKTLTFAFTGKTENSVKHQGVLNLSSTDIASDGDIISAKLRFKRISATYDVPASTSSSSANSSYSNASSLANSGYSNVASNANSLFSNTYAGGASQIVGTGSSVGTVAVSAATWYIIAQFSASSTETGGSIYVVNAIGATDTPGLKIRISVADENYYPKETPDYYRTISTGYYSTFVIYVPQNIANKTVYIEAYHNNGSSQNISFYVDYQTWGYHVHNNTYSDGSHTNINTYSDGTHTNSNTYSDGNHSNDLTRSKYAPGGESAYNFNIDVDGTNRATVNNINVAGDSGEIDLSTWITTRGQHYIEIYPTGASQIAQLEGETTVKYWSDDI